MGHMRFWRRVKIAPGLTLNLSKSGGSLSFGPRGAKYYMKAIFAEDPDFEDVDDRLKIHRLPIG